MSFTNWKVAKSSPPQEKKHALFGASFANLKTAEIDPKKFSLSRSSQNLHKALSEPILPSQEPTEPAMSFSDVEPILIKHDWIGK